MCRNWKSAAALGLTVLLGCMLPMSTMLAAEDDVETEAASVSENDVSDEEVPGKEEAGILTVAETEPGVVPNEAETHESADVPEIAITRGGADKTCSLGGEVTFEYVNNWGSMFEVSVNQSGENASVYCYKDKVTDMEAEAKKEADMDSLGWGSKQSPPMSIEPLSDGCYVVYVKVETVGGEKYYARSNGIVVDTVRPVIKGVEEGNVYSEGTLFQVEDSNLDYVLVNEQLAASENGSYKVTANGTSCVIRAKDKAGNEETCSITVSETETPEPKPEEPKPEEPKPEEPKPEEPGTGTETPDDSNVISKSGEYTLKVGVKYHLADGKWKLAGDSSVYQGGNDFYVNADGTYTFSK